MSTLTDLLAEHTGLPGAAVDHLQMVAAEWQLLSDLAFADFVLWVPLDAHQSPDCEYLCVAQARPTTGPTSHPDDMVGSTATAGTAPGSARAVRCSGVSATYCDLTTAIWTCSSLCFLCRPARTAAACSAAFLASAADFSDACSALAASAQSSLALRKVASASGTPLAVQRLPMWVPVLAADL